MFNNEPMRASYCTRREPGSSAFQYCAARGMVSSGYEWAWVRVRAKFEIDLNSLAKTIFLGLIRQINWSSMIPEL